MFNLTTQSTTKFGILVTSFVLLAACSAKQIKSESDAFQPTPDPIVDASNNETEYNYNNETAYSDAKSEKKKIGHFKKSKKKSKYVKSGKKAKGKKLAKRSQKKETLAAAVAQIDNGSTPNGGIGQYQPPVIVAEPVAPPPPFLEHGHEDTATVAELAGSWTFWIVLVSAVGLLGLVYRARQGKGSRRLIFN